MLPIRGIHVLAALLNLQDRHLWQKLRHARPSHRTYCGMPLEHSRYNWGRLKLHVNVYVAYCGHFQLHRTFFLVVFSGCQFWSFTRMSFQSRNRSSWDAKLTRGQSESETFFSLRLITHATNHPNNSWRWRHLEPITYHLRDAPLDKAVHNIAV